MNPAINAVKRPFSGETPEAIAKAIASGIATIPVIIPANISLKSCSFEIPSSKTTNNFGVNSFFKLPKSFLS